MKTAIIHDWFYTNGGAEKVVKSMNRIWPKSSLFSVIDYLSDSDREFILDGKRAKTTFIQKLPGSRRNHRKYLQFFPAAIESFNLSEFDLILSSSSSVAKGVLTSQNQLHICYCHSPARYAWDLYFQYLSEARLLYGLKGMYARYVLRKFRIWDFVTHQRVDHFIANSKYIASRIRKVYGRDSHVIYPPVNTNFFQPGVVKEDFYFTASRLVSYKKIDIIVKAFKSMPNKKLIVAGTGPDLGKIKALCGSNIQLLGYVSDQEMLEYMQRAKGFVFMAEEDFGILPVEAQACGTPVIAYGKGGTLETVIDGKTGVLFKKQREEDLISAIDLFEETEFNSADIRANACRFSEERFESELKSFVEIKYEEFSERKRYT